MATVSVAVFCVLLPLSEAERTSGTVAQTRSDLEGVVRTQEDWTTPRPLFGNDADRRVARFASFASSEAQTYLVGNNVPTLFASSIGPQPLSVWKPDGGEVGRPHGDFSFAFPKSFVDDRGRLHLVWAEPDSATRSRAPFWMGVPFTSVWTSSYSAPAGWTVPRALYAGPSVAWGKEVNGAFVRIRDGFLLPVPLPLSASVLVLVYRNESWENRNLRAPGATYAAAAVAGGRTFIAFGSGTVAAGYDFSSSDDDGRTWSAAQPLIRPVDNPVSELTIAGGETGLHAVWVETSRTSGAVLRHMVSRDRGRRWSTPTNLSSGTNLPEVRVQLDRESRVHTVYEHWNTAQKTWHIDHAIWDGEWSAAKHLFLHLRANDVALGLRENGAVALVFMAQHADQALDSRQATMYSELVR